MTTVKVCFGAEIHRISGLHPSLNYLTQYISSIFRSTLPQNWIFYYIDSDGDKIIMADQDDYDQFRRAESSSSVIPKLYIIPAEVHQTNERQPEIQIVDSANRDNRSQNLRIVYEERKEKEENRYSETKADIKSAQLERSSVDERKMESKFPKSRDSVQVANEAMSNDKVGIDVSALENLVAGIVEKKVPKNEQRNSSIDSENISTKKPQEVQVVHYGIRCDGCRIEPIVGTRYKCLTCTLFNYCDKCEKTGGHPHNFIKMRQRDVNDMFKPSKSTINTPGSQPRQNKLNDSEIQQKRDKESSSSGRAYFEALIEKVKILHKKFPKANASVLCAYVNGAPEDMTIEELIENYKY